ncbi:MAG: hypothetical protein GC138_05495 [Gammaproteobacteria bacterium]|nr:hypothetical protein [Gammaproteobacteria bacterium]
MQAGAAVKSDIIGKVDRIIVDNPTDTWSRGTMVVSGRNIIIPRNMVIDLPANRMTLQQLFVNAPSLCAAIDDNGDGIPDETGLAKGDHCNGTGTGAAATILGNKTNAGDLIAGEIMLEKAAEVVTGVISYIDYSQGYFRVNGIPGDTSTGLMIRIDDPEGRHTHQLGLGCNGSGPNCSADTRYGVDPDNYTFTASTGYPMCIPSTSARGPFDFAVMNPDGTIGPVQTNLTAQAASDGTGDILCPAGNHVPGTVGGDAVDSRLFAPIQLGDHVVAEGNYEHIAGVTFLSAHTATVSVGITTLNVPTQPDYLIFDEVGWDVSGYQNLRARDLLIGFTTIADPGVDIFGLYGDPATNTFKELVFATTVGCDIAAGVGTCTAQGLVGNNGIFKIVHDVDFINANLGVLPIARRSPCQQLNAAYLNGGIPDANGNFITTDPKGRCTGALTINKEFEVLVPPTRDIIGRSRHKHTLAPGIVTLDFHGRESQNGQYLNPVGITHPEFVEINLAALNTAYIFSGEPWNLDRRLGPGGCDGACESTATVPMGDPSMRLDPFPFSALDPGTPDGLAPSPAGTGVPVVSPHTTQRGRILSYWPLTGQELPWPPADPPYQGIVPTATVTNLMCTTL